MTDERIVVVQGGKLTSIVAFGAVILLILLIVGGYFAYKSIKDENIRLQNEIVEFKNVTDTLVRSSTKWATKDDLENQLKNLLTKSDLNALQNDLNKLQAQLTAVGRTVGTISGKVAKLESSDRQGPENALAEKCADGRLIDTYGYTKAPQIKLLTDINMAPIAEVQFNASSAKPWAFEIYKRDYQLITTIGKKDDGQLVMYHNLTYSIPDKDKDKKYNIDILSSDYIQAPLTNKMWWLNPRIDGNFFVGGKVLGFASGSGNPDNLLSLGVDIGVSLSSYGTSKIDSWFRFFRIGAGYSVSRNAGHLSFAPVAFNLGKALPPLTNLYLTPQIAIDTAGGLTVNFGIGPQF